MPTATVSISTAAGTTAIDRRIFGSFIEHFHRLVYGGIFDPGSPLADARGFRTDVADAVRELGVPVVRWPGGCFVSAYHWLDGVGDRRLPRFDKAWLVTDPNTFGTHEFVQWCDLVGTEPYICTNAGTGTPEEMSDWLEYCNSSAGGAWARLRDEHGSATPFAVPFWSIGNENYGDWEIGAKSLDEWARFVTESAKMMRRVDPNVHILTAARADLDWTLPLLESAGPYLDSVSIHGYWDILWEHDRPSDYRNAIAHALAPETDIDRMAAIVQAAGFAGKVSIAFDEWNLRGWHHPPGGPAAIAARDRNDRHETYTMADAVFAAGFWNACIRRSDVVRMANLAPLVNGRGPLYADADGIVRRTTFHVLQMYSQLLGDRRVDAFCTADDLEITEGAHVPVVDAVVTRKGEHLAIAVVNRHPEQPARCALLIDGTPVTSTISCTTLGADSPEAFNSPTDPDRVQPRFTTIDSVNGTLVLPPHSVTVCSLRDPRTQDIATGPSAQTGASMWRSTGSGASSARPGWTF